MNPSKVKAPDSTRSWPRFSLLKDVSLNYEGRSEVLSVHLPDISPTGMFVNTPTTYPEGTVFKVSFRLSHSNHAVDVRGEVRYCLPGVGVGVEFIDIRPEDEKAIQKELRASLRRLKRTK